jgi:hypothetical protein
MQVLYSMVLFAIRYLPILYIEKETQRNGEVERLCLTTTVVLKSREDGSIGACDTHRLPDLFTLPGCYACLVFYGSETVWKYNSLVNDSHLLE